ncbi:glycosyl-phosphatidylinositol-anchored molecule-like protein [Lepus europaeus]|uniref:glycosyl-phosphatidylinositol-anchored molecule-like protein n=1 Tax=Lepus europaeus TaxID=9983 RepID=UPI002B472610|nr:glycosyl-phosphatidylinositol-anchored molecule-like protein [Lepus europaeus]XP_062043912.1 glycosyl-phosphatidylinositol-anchored molecule-like protein [Lepus europaeus]
MLPLALLLTMMFPLVESNVTASSEPWVDSSITTSRELWVETNITTSSEPWVDSSVTTSREPGLESNVTVSSEQRWTYNMRCHDCEAINNFNCDKTRTCPYDIRRCMTVSLRLNPREMLIYKNCTYNCSFVYSAIQPPEAPRFKIITNSFYFLRCCGGITCNEGGPTNLERDMEPETPIEEPLPESAIRLSASQLFLSVVSIIVSNLLTRDPLLGWSTHLPCPS